MLPSPEKLGENWILGTLVSYRINGRVGTSQGGQEGEAGLSESSMRSKGLDQCVWLRNERIHKK